MTFIPTVTVALLAEVGFGQPTANQTMAFTLISARARAKTRDRVWGNSNGNPFIMATPP